MKTGSSIYYYHTDHLGSSSVMTDSSGIKKDEIYYYPYGKTRSDSAIVLNPKHKFTGQEFDSETGVGLYYYGARYYDPEIGRFISADSIVQDYTDPQTLNRYSYCRNNPVILTDPSGNIFGIDDVAIIVGAVIGAISSGAQSDWNMGDMITGAFIGGISGGVGFGAGSWAYGVAGGEGFGALMAGGIVGGAAGGATGGGLSAAFYGGNIGEGVLKGAGFGVIAGGVTAGLIYTGVPNAIAAAVGGAASGYAQCGGSCAGEGALYSFGGSVLSAGLRTFTGIGMDGKLPREGTKERVALETKNNTYVLTPEVHSNNKFWIMIGLLLGGYEHTWHTQDRLHGLYEEEGTSRYYSLIKENVSYPPNAESYLGENFNLISNNCTTRFGFLHPAQYFSNYHYMYTSPYWWNH